MGYITILAIVIPIVFLAVNRIAMLRSLLPRWLQVEEHAPQASISSHGPLSAPPDAGEDANEDLSSTPTTQPTSPAVDIPSLSLEISEPDAVKSDLVATEPLTDGPYSPANRLSNASMASPPKPISAQQKDRKMMPPPPRLGVSPSSAAGGLRIPTTGPLPNRGFPANSQQRVSSGLAPTATHASSNARGKVLLAPGHSPMDWAALIRTGNLSGVSTFQRVTPSQLRQMTGRKGKPAWSSWQGEVYNITPYLPFHPGGEAELMKAAGRDGTKLFMEVHPWVNWENMLGACLVGVLVAENHSSPLDDMD